MFAQSNKVRTVRFIRDNKGFKKSSYRCIICACTLYLKKYRFDTYFVYHNNNHLEDWLGLKQIANWIWFSWTQQDFYNSISLALPLWLTIKGAFSRSS